MASGVTMFARGNQLKHMARKVQLLAFFFFTGWWFQTFGLFSISYMGYIILPIDELIFFRGLKLPTRLYFALLMVNIPLIILMNTVSHGINYQLKNIHLLQGIFSWPWNKPNDFHTHPLHQLARHAKTSRSLSRMTGRYVLVRKLKEMPSIFPIKNNLKPSQITPRRWTSLSTDELHHFSEG